MYIEFNVKI